MWTLVNFLHLLELLNCISQHKDTSNMASHIILSIEATITIYVEIKYVAM